MTLKNYQQEIEAGVLYAVNAKGGFSGSEQLNPSLEVIGGTVDVYGSQVQPDTPPTGMYKTATAFSGIDAFGVVPNFLYIDGTADSIVLSGVQATEVA